MNALIRKIKSSGPAAIITSAFIGPGTIIVSTKAGIAFGYSLIWAVIFAVISLMFLMEMASRVAIITKQDLIQATINVIPNSIIWKRFIQGLMLLAVLTVCFAFQAGNFSGGSLGLANALGLEQKYVVILMTMIVLLITLLGSSHLLELIMKLFVGFMGIVFVITFLFIQPNVFAILKGVIPNIPEGGYVLTLALIGTTLIGINLILHSITSKDRWSKETDLIEAKWDIGINILIGGLITFSIVVTSATVLQGTNITGNPALMFTQSLKPVLGDYASLLGNLGLFAAGLSSAIAIPFTLKKITTGVFQFKDGAQGRKANILAIIAILFGAVLAIIGKNPQQIIILAQATSGFFLPLITILILIVTNNKQVLGRYVNKPLQNVVGGLVVILTLALGIQGIRQAVINFFNLLG
ncbi:Nramp family divalent metal transporter [Mergibacter septicus]|nr:Nramp family divalent metal transporter [Mergibacter septicus]UTU47877.1 Nramp family divalent metal transporter [Mergibacter septicus]WMR96516.1 Nramp family divalent metal transporter [Mergibacter septicus]